MSCDHQDFRERSPAGGAVTQRRVHPGTQTQTSLQSTPSVPALLHHLDDVRQARNAASLRFLQNLTPHLHAARAVERELDRLHESGPHHSFACPDRKSSPQWCRHPAAPFETLGVRFAIRRGR